jgi:hypothetical protein
MTPHVLHLLLYRHTNGPCTHVPKVEAISFP